MSTAALKVPHGISYEDFLATVEDGVQSEWVDGEVLVMNPPSREHARISTFLAAILGAYVARRRLGGQVLHAPFQMKLARSGREPDVLFVAEENLGRFRSQYFEGPGDLAVEIVSPDSRTRDRKEKFREYEEAGVAEYWLIDPMKRTAEVYRLTTGGTYALVPPGDPPRLRSEVIPGLWVDPAWLWAEFPDQWVAYEEWGLI